MMNDIMNDIMISVHMLTYNHVDTIGKAIEGVVNQKTQYTFELVIGDDASTDGTSEIVKEYAKKYPKIIKAVCREKNIGASENNADILRRCKGKYIAVCEGDDVWVDENKLECQVGYLELHQDYSMCVTKCIYIDNGEKKEYPFSRQDSISAEDMLNGGVVKRYATCTFVLRNIYQNNPDYIELFRQGFIGDLVHQTIMIQNGKIYYLDKETAEYNHITNKEGSFSANSLEWQVQTVKKAVSICDDLTKREYSKEWHIYASSFDVELFWKISSMVGKKNAINYMLKSLNGKDIIFFIRRLLYDYKKVKKESRR